MREQGEGGGVGEELGARGEKEGSRREKEEGDGEDLRLLELHPPAPRSAGEREGAPCIPVSPPSRTPAPSQSTPGMGGQKLPLS